MSYQTCLYVLQENVEVFIRDAVPLIYLPPLPPKIRPIMSTYNDLRAAYVDIYSKDREGIFNVKR
jgi:hypothetical protein